jgi:hypothetical protein
MLQLFTDLILYGYYTEQSNYAKIIILINIYNFQDFLLK